MGGGGEERIEGVGVEGRKTRRGASEFTLRARLMLRKTEREFLNPTAEQRENAVKMFSSIKHRKTIKKQRMKNLKWIK